MTELKLSFCAILFHCFSIYSNFSRLGKFRVERDLNPMLHWRSKVDEDQDSLMKPYFFFSLLSQPHKLLRELKQRRLRRQEKVISKYKFTLL